MPNPYHNSKTTIESPAIPTMAIIANSATGLFRFLRVVAGELAIADNLVKAFREKPQVAEGWINGGFFVFEKRAFDLIRPDQNVTLEEAVLEALAAKGELSVYKHHGFWQSMDTFREMTLLNDLWDSGRGPWHIWKECKLSA